MFDNSSKPRGIRNNNPLNLKYSSKNRWKGLAGSDGTFCTFTSAAYGIRAAYKTMLSYEKVLGKEFTLSSMIHRWCPDSTAVAYIAFVSKNSGILCWQPVPLKDKVKMCDVIRAMIIMENGYCPYTHQVIYSGLVI